jgi:branched-chain amino acid aminotransferase
MILWLGEGLVEAAEARIDPADRGLTLGDGLFETVRVSGGRPLRFADHLRRLHRGAALLGLPVPLSDAALGDAAEAVLRANGLAGGLVDAVLRITLTRGVGARGIAVPDPCRPTLAITAAARPPAPGPALIIGAGSTRRNDRSPLSRIKSLNYLDNILARQEADRAGADDAVLLNTRDRVACATVATLFAVVDGALVTPPEDDGALPGIRRGELLAEGAETRPLSVADLRRATEIFLTNCLSVRPVIILDGSPVGDGRPGPTAAGLLEDAR